MRILESQILCFSALVGRRRIRGMAREGLNLIGLYSRLFLLGEWDSNEAD